MKTPFAAMHLLAEAQRIPEALRFERAARDPQGAQRARLRAMALLNGDTEFGRKHGLSSVRSLKDLQARVPVQTYADVEPWISRTMRGERNLLSSEAPVFYASSTGTTGEPKRTPTTPSFRREFQCTVQVSMAQVAARFPGAFRGSLLYFVGRREIARAPDGTPIGFTSGFNFTTLPPLVRRVYAWPYELFEVDDAETRNYLSIWIAALSHVTFAAGIFPLALLTLFRAAEAFAEPLTRDLAQGTLRDDLRLTAAQRALFARFARRDVAAADRVASDARANGGKLPVRAYLPHLRLLYCWTSGSAGHYLPDLKERLGEAVAVRDAIYAANEGWCNCTFGEEGLGGPLCVTGHFYELVEVDAWERGERVGIGTEALEPGRSYRLLVTNSAGLWRYDLGDVVTCTGRYRETPTVHFSRRSGASTNICGEKMDETHVLRAASRVLADRNMRAPFFALRPRWSGRPRYELLLELEERPDRELAAALRSELDDALARENDDYGHRRGGVLGRLALFVLSPGEHERERARKIARGAPAAQLKTVHLVSAESDLAHLDVALVAD